jgi:hypothetical protein
MVPLLPRTTIATGSPAARSLAVRRLAVLSTKRRVRNLAGLDLGSRFREAERSPKKTTPRAALISANASW